MVAVPGQSLTEGETVAFCTGQVVPEGSMAWAILRCRVLLGTTR